MRTIFATETGTDTGTKIDSVTNKQLRSDRLGAVCVCVCVRTDFDEPARLISLSGWSMNRGKNCGLFGQR